MGPAWIIAVDILIILLTNLGCYVFNENSIFWRLPRCSKSLLFVSNRKDTSTKHSRPATWFAWDLLQARELYTSPVLGTFALALYRILEFGVVVATIVFGNVLYGPSGPSFFIYFTNWTFVLFGFTGIFGAILTAKKWQEQRRPTLPCIETQQPVGQTPGWSRTSKVYHLLLQTVCAASIMLTIFYWVADYRPGLPFQIDDPFKHGVPAVVLLGDLALSRVPVVSYHYQVVIAYGTVYMVFMWLYFVGSGRWIYRALDWSKPTSAIYYAALPLLLLVGYAVMLAVASIREFLLVRYGNSCCCCLGCCKSSADKQLSSADMNKITAKPLALDTGSAVPQVEASAGSPSSSSNAVGTLRPVVMFR